MVTQTAATNRNIRQNRITLVSDDSISHSYQRRVAREADEFLASQVGWFSRAYRHSSCPGACAVHDIRARGYRVGCECGIPLDDDTRTALRPESSA